MDDWLMSEETGEPFSHCVACRLPLLETDSPWLVNKDYFHGECVLEYAICQRCREEVSKRISEGSKAAVRGFLEREIAWEKRVAEFLSSGDLLVRFARCISCAKERGECDGYAISALFDAGGELVTGPLPLLICRSCVARMTEGLSEDSRQVWKEFLAQHFAGPPDASGFPGLL
jgi:hypothetical protein